MTQYLQVCENENSEVVEIPTEEDGTLSFAALENLYPGVTDLKYVVNGVSRLVKISDGKFVAPSEGWGNHKYYCVYPKDSKRKLDESDSKVSKSAKTDISDDAKTNWASTDLVVLGLAWQTTDKELVDYFSKFGELQFAQVKTDPVTKKSRGFGFIRFLDNEVQVRVMLQRHEIDGRWCDVRVSQSKDMRTKKVSSKIFVGQCTEEMTEDDFRDHFGKFGEISDVFVPKPFRGFAFVTFTSSDAVEAVYRQQHYIRDKKVLVTEAIPKNSKELTSSKSSRSSRSTSGRVRDSYYKDRYGSDYGSRREEKSSWHADSRYAADDRYGSDKYDNWSRRSPATWREKTPPDVSSDLVAKVVNKAVLGVFENLKSGPSQVSEPPEREWWSRR